MPNKVNLIYKLEGERVSEGVDVFELSPILLSLGELIRESKKTLDPLGRDISVNVKPFERGSFIIDIVLFSKDNLQAIIDFANQDQVQEIKTVLEWLGLISGGSLGLVGVIKHLKGKPKLVEDLGPDEIRYIPFEGNAITVRRPVHRLFSNPEIVEAVMNIYKTPLNQTGISEVISYLKDEQSTAVSVIKAESIYFASLEGGLPGEGEQIVENTAEVYLKPKRGSFEGEANAWSFRRGANRDNRDIVTATFKDEAFLGKLRTGEIRLFTNDLMRVKLLERQHIRGQEIQNSQYEILEVLEYKKAPEQPLLLNNSE